MYFKVRSVAFHLSFQTIALLVCVASSQDDPNLLSFVSQAQPNATSSYISENVFRSLAKINRAAINKLEKSKGIYLSHPSIVNNTDAHFRAVFGINSESIVLKPKEAQLAYKHYTSTLHDDVEVTEPFVSRVSFRAGNVLNVFKAMTNNTYELGSLFASIGTRGVAMRPGPASNVLVIVQYCRSFKIYAANGTLEQEIFYDFARSVEPFPSVLISMKKKNSPVLCGGSGLTFSDHRDLSQRVWKRKTFQSIFLRSVGPVSASSLNEGNAKVSLTENMREFLEKEHDQNLFNIELSSQMMRLVERCNQRSHLGLIQYNNVAFFISSITAVVTSVAISTITKVTGYPSLLLFLGEAALMYSFLGILSYAYLSLTRLPPYLITAREKLESEFMYNEKTVGASFETLLLGAGVRNNFPKLLLAILVLTLFAAAFVTCSVACKIWSLWIRKKRRLWAEVLHDQLFVESLERCKARRDMISKQVSFYCYSSEEVDSSISIDDDHFGDIISDISTGSLKQQ